MSGSAAICSGAMYCGVRRRTQRRQSSALLWRPRRIQRLADPEVADGRTFAREEDIFRFDVPVHDAVFVRELECSRDIANDPDGYRSLAWRRSGRDARAAISLHERHCVERQPIALQSRGRDDVCGCCSRAVRRISRLKRSRLTRRRASTRSSTSSSRGASELSPAGGKHPRNGRVRHGRRRGHSAPHSDTPCRSAEWRRSRFRP